MLSVCLSSSHSITFTNQNYQKTGYLEAKFFDLEIHITKLLITQHSVQTIFADYPTRNKETDQNSGWELCVFGCPYAHTYERMSSDC